MAANTLVSFGANVNITDQVYTNGDPLAFQVESALQNTIKISTATTTGTPEGKALFEGISSYELTLSDLSKLQWDGEGTWYFKLDTDGKIKLTATPPTGSSTPLTAPTLNATPASKTATSVTLAPPGASVQDTEATFEYRKSNNGGDWGVWQANPTFDGLTAVTKYWFQARYVVATTETWSNSPASASVDITTSQAPATAPYTVTAAGAASATTSDTDYAVAVKLTSDIKTAFAPFQATLNYDSTKFEYETSQTTKFNADLTVTKPQDGQILLTYQGSSTDLSSLTADTIATLHFTPKAATTTAIAFTLTDVKAGESGDLSQASEPTVVNLTGVTVTQGSDVTVTAYNAVGSGYKLLKYKSDTLPANGKTYGGEKMYYAPWLSSASEHYFLFIVADTVTASNYATIADGDSGGQNALTRGEVNGEAGIDIFDAQAAFDLATIHASKTFEVFSVASRLAADVDGDGNVDAVDARATQMYIHNGNWDA
jgi:hypothetical protein